jgi:hypothetical protein
MQMTLRLAVTAALLLSTPTLALAQRYDSSYGYEMRGFVPPSPFPRDLERRERSHDADYSIREHNRVRTDRGSRR